MMRSLWSGVSGLNAHQVAMDVEGNNIANVNTTGFKYSRTNFQDLLSQTQKSATAPQGNLGGKNGLQVGLGANVSSVETMFKQGSIQNTDKNTDMAISGNGFFVVTGDGGKTSKYTRAGDFSFDNDGNFVDSNGYIVEGWMADLDTYKVDSSAGVKPIRIPPGLTTPAKATSEVSIKANLNSGDKIKESSPTNATLLPTRDLNGTYNAIGEKINLTADTDKFKFILKKADGTEDTVTLTYGKSQSDTDGKFTNMRELLAEINRIIKDTTGEKRREVYLTGNGRIYDPDDTITFDTTSNSGKFAEVLKELNGSSTQSGNVKWNKNVFIGADDVGELFNGNGEALNLDDGQGISASIEGLGETRKFIYSSTPITSNEGCGGSNGAYQAKDPIISDSNEGMHWTYDSNNNRAYFNVNQKVKFTDKDDNTYTYVYGKDFQTINDLCCKLNKDLSDNDENDNITFSDGKIKESDGSVITQVEVQDSNGNAVNDTSGLGLMGDILKGLDGTNDQTYEFKKNDIYYFHDISDLENLWQLALDDSGDPLNSTSGNKGVITINKDGKIEIDNNGSNSFNIKTSGYPDEDHDNDKFTDIFSSVNGTLAAGGSALSGVMEAASHTTSLDIFDSLGSKHTLTFHYRKSHTSTNPNDPTVWNFYAEVPEPSTLDNPANGYVKFNPDGSLNSFNPPSLIFNANNGSNDGQAIQLGFGHLNGFDGLTSFDADSSTSGQTQDGYPGGDLQDLTIDQTGTIIGVFTNGRSYSLAQVALAKFVNNEGLMHEGGSLFSASANSGDPIIGTAGTGGRGTIQSSALEMSNVDLSKSLTELIVIQRGFQANSKTITTSDQMLQTLLDLKR